ncbi:DNA translocase FtsK [Desulfotalea psychrophila]|uniref:Related to cell division protein (FtsK) n=1 Tax=Desulfotalea psychrophila (strain LSv54 / DSM 12343) TaxID=177439 RepID=Q6AP92_DESPS|nr:DNA translocase FtsK [Desulfotalea psychrophila]CAG35832.1 related to cell division protein (FtsK) [Desulfotalea psychrophila LSv54]
MARKQEAIRPDFRQEVVAVLGGFSAIFLLFSLVSRSLADSVNWCGWLGGSLANSLFAFIGYGAYLLVLILFCVSLSALFSKISPQRFIQLSLALAGVLLSFCGLLHSLFLADPALHGFGGFLGEIVYVSLQSTVGLAGTFLVLFCALLLSGMLVSQCSLYAMAFSLAHLLSYAMSCWLSLVVWLCHVLWKKRTRSEVNLGRKMRSHSTQSGVPLVREIAMVEGPVDQGFTAQPVARGAWRIPPLSLLSHNKQDSVSLDKSVYYGISAELEKQLNNFSVQGKVVGVVPGPVVTTYEYAPAPGVKISKIVGLANDLALGLKVRSVRVVGSIPGKAALGIEIPNEHRQMVFIRDLLSRGEYQKNSDKLTVALGLDVVGNPVMANLAKMPHLLIAGATGAGKSVGINTIIASILYKATPDEVRFLLVDPKRIELSGYEGIPHLLHPVVVDPGMASRALAWAVAEMKRRYCLLAEAGVKSFASYNKQKETEKLPYIVIVVDELADLMMVASKDVEDSIASLAQMARAAGMHMILATHRPSVDVLPGVIKPNFPPRISFKVSSRVDSRTILDCIGAEQLLGAGDMLFLPPGTSALMRIHGAYISEKETADIVDFFKEQGATNYDKNIIEQIKKEKQGDGAGGDDQARDPRYDEAVVLVTEAGQASISLVQRRMRIGYNRAARMIELMEREGLVGPADGAKARQVLVRQEYN